MNKYEIQIVATVNVEADNEECAIKLAEDMVLSGKGGDCGIETSEVVWSDEDE